MRYPEYEELLAESRPGTAAYTPHTQTDLLKEDVDIERLLTGAQNQEQGRIEAELGQIESRLQDRKELHDESVAELEDAVRVEKDRLQRLQHPFSAEDRVTSQKRRIRELEQQLQEIQRAYWQDCEQLQRERRRLQRELTELSDTDLSLFF
ncbi:hypothetical protein [Natrinema marinum]|uniref:hypothetical protein n=1 Tax=Natrinema marinum TaxID=2961598 RepID=UPI0020C8866C|nr:hypothetical protein [Natrinema marinum]